MFSPLVGFSPLEVLTSVQYPYYESLLHACDALYAHLRAKYMQLYLHARGLGQSVALRYIYSALVSSG